MEIPLPVQFNRWKHHAGFIKRQINDSQRDRLPQLIMETKVIGEGIMDLYIGNIEPENISEMILSQLKPGISKQEYSDWLIEKGDDFRLLQIPDSSLWVLRSGDDDHRYVHIHPARYSPLTIRIKAPTLKTAIITAVYQKHYKDSIDLDLINRIRAHFIKLPPVKDLRSVPALNKILIMLIT